MLRLLILLLALPTASAASAEVWITGSPTVGETSFDVMMRTDAPSGVSVLGIELHLPNGSMLEWLESDILDTSTQFQHDDWVRLSFSGLVNGTVCGDDEPCPGADGKAFRLGTVEADLAPGCLRFDPKVVGDGTFEATDLPTKLTGASVGGASGCRAPVYYMEDAYPRGKGLPLPPTVALLALLGAGVLRCRR